MITASLIPPDPTGRPRDGVVVDAHVDTRRRGAGLIDHTLTLDAAQGGNALWQKKITFGVDAPFDVPDLPTIDPFVIAALFPAMEVGGTLRAHGRVSRTLIRNLLDFQSAWSLAAPQFCHPFDLDVQSIDDDPAVDPGPHPKAILPFTAGMDSLLALCRNVSGDAGQAGYDIGATMMIHGMGTGRQRNRDPATLIADLRAISDRWNVPLTVVDTNISEVVGKDQISHGTWLAACLSLFAGRFSVGLIGSSVPYYWSGWEVFGSHPLLDPLLSSGRMSIRNDEALFDRVDKAALLARYPSALTDLRVCIHLDKPERNCCRCEKCIRTMLSFVASGNPIPPAFPHGLRLRDIGIGMGDLEGVDWGPVLLNSARRYGTQSQEPIKTLRRRFRIKRLKVMAKGLPRLLRTGRRTPRWHVFDKARKW